MSEYVIPDEAFNGAVDRWLRREGTPADERLIVQRIRIEIAARLSKHWHVTAAQSRNMTDETTGRVWTTFANRRKKGQLDLPDGCSDWVHFTRQCVKSSLSKTDELDRPRAVREAAKAIAEVEAEQAAGKLDPHADPVAEAAERKRKQLGGGHFTDARTEFADTLPEDAALSTDPAEIACAPVSRAEIDAAIDAIESARKRGWELGPDPLPPGVESVLDRLGQLDRANAIIARRQAEQQERWARLAEQRAAAAAERSASGPAVQQTLWGEAEEQESPRRRAERKRGAAKARPVPLALFDDEAAARRAKEQEAARVLGMRPAM